MKGKYLKWRKMKRAKMKELIESSEREGKCLKDVKTKENDWKGRKQTERGESVGNWLKVTKTDWKWQKLMEIGAAKNNILQGKWQHTYLPSHSTSCTWWMQHRQPWRPKLHYSSSFVQPGSTMWHCPAKI